MKKIALFTYLSISTLIPSYVYAVDCDGILRHGLRNIQVSKNTEASIATKYFNHCNKNFTSINDELLGSIEVEILGYGGGSGSYNRKQREERLTDWCKTNSSTAELNKASYEESQTIYGDAVSAWDNCNKLSSRDVIITPFISPDALDVDFTLRYTGSTKSGVKFYGVTTQGFKCDVIVPGEGGTVPFDSNNPPEIKQEAISISCTREKSTLEKINNQEYQIIPRGLITVKTASFPLQLYFPKEYKPALPDQKATLLEKKISEIEAQIAFPKNSIIPWLGNTGDIPKGWVICGNNGTQNLDGKYLIGEETASEIGQIIGNIEHLHKFSGVTSKEVEGSRDSAEGADNFTGSPNWNHKHSFSGNTEKASNYPPSVKAHYLCKI